MAEYFQFNLNDILREYGESRTITLLSSFSCLKNRDIELYLKDSAIVHCRSDISKTHLVFLASPDKKEKELLGYFSIAQKHIELPKKDLSKTMIKRAGRHGAYNQERGAYIIPAPLIGQLGKNFTNGNDTLISGSELLSLALDKIQNVQNEIGEKFVYLECEDVSKVLEFYTNNGFRVYGSRCKKETEIGVKTNTLIQLLRYM